MTPYIAWSMFTDIWEEHASGEDGGSNSLRNVSKWLHGITTPKTEISVATTVKTQIPHNSFISQILSSCNMNVSEMSVAFGKWRCTVSVKSSQCQKRGDQSLACKEGNYIQQLAIDMNLKQVPPTHKCDILPRYQCIEFHNHPLLTNSNIVPILICLTILHYLSLFVVSLLTTCWVSNRIKHLSLSQWGKAHKANNGYKTSKSTRPVGLHQLHLPVIAITTN
jgi:hypothetical protein